MDAKTLDGKLPVVGGRLYYPQTCHSGSKVTAKVISVKVLMANIDGRFEYRIYDGAALEPNICKGAFTACFSTEETAAEQALNELNSLESKYNKAIETANFNLQQIEKAKLELAIYLPQKE